MKEPHRLGLALELGEREFLVLERVPGRLIGRLADADAVNGRDALQPRRRVNHVARDQTLAKLGARIQRDDPFTGVDPDPDMEVYPVALSVEVSEGIEDPETGADGSLGIILVRDWSPENGHDGVPDELLDGAAVALDLGSEELVVRLETPGRPLDRRLPRSP